MIVHQKELSAHEQQRPLTQDAWLLGLLFFIALALACPPADSDRPIYDSPDETAMATVATALAHGRSAAIAEPLAVDVPWLHPRSWVAVGPRLVPVAFLGWPWFISFAQRLIGEAALVWSGPLLMASVVYPLYGCWRRHGRVAAIVGVLLVVTYPGWILYAHRGLFPNGPNLALAIWGFWGLQRWALGDARLWRVAISGFMCALSLAVRPIEGLWLLPWWLWSARTIVPDRRPLLAFFSGSLVVALPMAWLAAQTYGRWYRIGYWLHDNPSLTDSSADAVSLIGSAQPSQIWRSVLPFGFHPHNIWWNVQRFYGQLLWPWLLLLVAGLIWSIICFFRERQRIEQRSGPWPAALIGWTTIVLLVLYGSGLYADQIQKGAVTIGNSFIRYTLAFGLFAAMSFISLSKVAQRSVMAKVGLIFTVSLISLFGIYTAYLRDDEGIWPERQALVEYAAVQTAARQAFHSRDVIVSERSDKIFFPSFRAVSPLPSIQAIRRLMVREQLQVGLFARPMSQQQKDDWRAEGLDVQEVAAFSRERLYRLVLR